MFLFCIALSINRNSNQWFLYPSCWLCTQLLIHVTWSVCACVSTECELMCHLFSLLLHVFTVQDGRCEFVNHHYSSCLWMPLPLTGVFLFVVHSGGWAHGQEYPMYIFITEYGHNEWCGQHIKGDWEIEWKTTPFQTISGLVVKDSWTEISWAPLSSLVMKRSTSSSSSLVAFLSFLSSFMVSPLCTVSLPPPFFLSFFPFSFLFFLVWLTHFFPLCLTYWFSTSVSLILSIQVALLKVLSRISSLMKLYCAPSDDKIQSAVRKSVRFP